MIVKKLWLFICWLKGLTRWTSKALRHHPPLHLLSAPLHPVEVRVAEITAGAWGPSRLLSAMTPAQEALRLVNQQLKACLRPLTQFGQSA